MNLYLVLEYLDYVIISSGLFYGMFVLLEKVEEEVVILGGGVEWKFLVVFIIVFSVIESLILFFISVGIVIVLGFFVFNKFVFMKVVEFKNKVDENIFLGSEGLVISGVVESSIVICM